MGFYRALSVFLIFLFPAVCVLLEADDARRSNPGTVVIKREPEKHYKLIPLSTMDFNSIEPVCRKMMSADGIITYEKHRNAILVYDTPQVIRKIQDFLQNIERDAVNVRIEMEYVGSGARQRSGLTMKPIYKRGSPRSKIIVKDGKFVKPKEVVITGVGRMRDYSTSNTSQFIVTRSGFPASIWIGKTVVDPSWLRQVRFRPDIIIVTPSGSWRIAGSDTDIKWADVGASLQVLPYYHDDGTIDLEIYPCLSVIDGRGHRRAVKVQSLITKLRLADGQRVNVGGLISGNRKMYTNLFGPDFFRRDDGVSINDMYITATALRPDGRRLKNLPSSGSSRGMYENPMDCFRR